MNFNDPMMALCFHPIMIVIYLLVIGYIALRVIHNRLNQKAEEERQTRIYARSDEWGKENCAALIRKSIDIDMTPEMVRLGWGKPNYIEEKSRTSRTVKVRWTYGEPRKGARYVWFTNDKVSKIEG